MHCENSLRPSAIEFFKREIDGFLPGRIFDAHAHLGHVFENPTEFVGYPHYLRLMKDLHQRNIIAATFIPPVSLVKEHSLLEANEWVAEQLAANRACSGLFLVKPDDDEEWVRQEVQRLGFSGIKCYHTMAKSLDNTWEAEIPDYLPEKLVRTANEEEWVIMLHIVRTRAVADPNNIHWIRHYCKKYPKMKLILAHSARGFQPSHNLEGLPQLAGLDNLYCDSSANCEQTAHQAVMRYLGHDKLLYGTDFPVSHKRGRSVGVADSFLWLHGDSPVWNEKHLKIKPVLVGLEHLRSLKWACWSERLSDSEIEDIFWNNAAKLFNID